MSHPLLNIAVLFVLGALVFGLSLFVRRRWTRIEGVNTEPWSATLSYVATAYGVLVGFSILLLFGKFADARHAVGDEATAIGTAFEEAALFPDSAPGIQTALVCYAESVVDVEWTAMRADGSAPEVDSAFADLVQALGHNDHPATGALHAATATNLASQVGAISTARETRLVAAEAELPTMLWILLIGGGMFVVVLIFVVTMGARPATQAGLVVTAAVFTVMMLLLVAALSTPFADGPGRVTPRLIAETTATMRASPNAAALGACPSTAQG
ncbi:MAG: DUF4239 domain-containing protein [Acidimicrobiia bacterium]|nr:DUF4239 domain-containing protein [Acidimicrobiia bacterium]